MTLDEFCLALSKSLTLCVEAPVAAQVPQGRNPPSVSHRTE